MRSPTSDSSTRVTVGVLALCGTLAALQFTILVPLIAEIPELLDVSPEDASWLITATMLTSAVSTPIMSRMADMYGKRRILVASLSGLVLGSAVCAFASSLALMLVGRSLQGLGTALIAVGVSLLRDLLPQERIASAVALMSATLGFGSALGLPLSGFLTKLFGWHSVFGFTAFAGALLLVAVLRFVPESPVRTPGRFDAGGALLLSIALVSLLLPVTKGTVWGWTSTPVVGLTVLGLLALAVWFPFQLRVNQPLVDLRTAARRPVLLTNLSAICVGFAMFVNMLTTTQFLQQPQTTGYGFGLSISATGLAMVPTGLAMVAISPITSRLIAGWGPRATLMLGTAIMTASYAARLYFHETVVEVVVGSTLVGIGTAISLASMPALIMSSVPITETASANGLNALLRYVGTSSGSAVVAMSLVTFTATVDGVVLPSIRGLELILLLALTATTLAVYLTWLIPPKSSAEASGNRKAGRSGEAVISGRLLVGQQRSSVHAGVVLVLDLKGGQLDWSRVDRDGGYSVVVPGPGTYLLSANALGWASAAQVLEFDGHQAQHDMHLMEQLTLSGAVTCDGRPCRDATVALNSLDGDGLGTVRTDVAGGYCFALPKVGLYVITAFDHATGRSHSRKVMTALESRVLNLELPR